MASSSRSYWDTGSGPHPIFSAILNAVYMGTPSMICPSATSTQSVFKNATSALLSAADKSIPNS